MIIVAIDPGASGAVSIVNTYKFRETYAIPLIHNTLSDIYLFLSEIKGGGAFQRARAHHIEPNIELRTIEPDLPAACIDPLVPENADDTSMEIWLEEPGQIVVNRLTKDKNATGALLAGMTASRKLGRSIGQWEGIATALNTKLELIPPKVWQSALNCNAKGDKKILKKCAESIFPHLTNSKKQSTITLDVADSLLIGAYAYMQYADKKYWPHSLKQYLHNAN